MANRAFGATLLLVAACSACAAAGNAGDDPAAGGSAEFSYAPYARVLSEHVDEAGGVDYAALKGSPGELDAFVAGLRSLDPSRYESWSQDAKIAFWINAYNALTLEAIVRNYPIEASLLRSFVYPKNSIRQIPGVWDELSFEVIGREVTLDEIEHAILRERFDEPRIHMALVCAARGCPPLRREPYAGERLDRQLEDQTLRFLSDPKKFRIDRADGEVHLSSIFDWFGEDFVSRHGTQAGFEGFDGPERAVLSFVASHLDGEDRRYLESADYSIDYLDYDWTLNEKGAMRRG